MEYIKVKLYLSNVYSRLYQEESERLWASPFTSQHTSSSYSRVGRSSGSISPLLHCTCLVLYHYPKIKKSLIVPRCDRVLAILGGTQWVKPAWKGVEATLQPLIVTSKATFKPFLAPGERYKCACVHVCATYYYYYYIISEAYCPRQSSFLLKISWI